MNQVQRKFLIDKVQSKSEEQVRELSSKLPDFPSASNHIIHAIMSNTVEIKSIEELRQNLLNRALGSEKGEQILGDRWGARNEITFKLEEFFNFPKDYQDKILNYKKVHSIKSIKIKEIQMQTEALIMRIQLASDKILQTMVNEVDDMGNLSLFDTTIKALTK